MASVGVVVATHRRPLRLRWLLNALDEQEGDFETVVAYDPEDEATARLLAERTARALPVSERSPAARRNAGWRATDAELIVFTDDDCRPPAGWLAALVARAQAGAVAQGATRVDPDELGVFRHAPYARSQQIEPVHPMGQTCNIAFPRALLEALGGFDESFPEALGEDTDLFLRAQRHGAAVVAAPDAVTYHAVGWGLRARLRGAGRWGAMALVVRRNPELRRVLPVGGWAFSAQHPRWLLAAAGLAVAAAPAASRRRRAAFAALALPWAAGTSRVYGSHPRALARSASELPGRFAIDGAETVALLRGSLRHRALLI